VGAKEGGAAGGGWMGLMAGEADLRGDGTVRGVGAFNTVSVLGVAAQTGGWYYEVELLSGGLMQLGWADSEFRGDSVNGDGVGDDVHSWAFDGARQQRWNGESSAYGVPWAAGDVIGCALDAGGGVMRFSHNGADMGVAFKGLKLNGAGAGAGGAGAGAGAGGASAGAGAGVGWFPAVSFEEDEELRINTGQRPWLYPPPAKHEPVQSAMAGVMGAAVGIASAAVEEMEAARAAEQAEQAAAAAKAAEAQAKAEAAKAARMAQMAKEAEAAEAGAEEAGAGGRKRGREEGAAAAKAGAPPPAPTLPEPLDLAPYKTAGKLEGLGLERLKAALMALGAKCGGTLQQRAERLLAFRGLAPEQYDRKLMEKKKKPAKK
jgi:hypothetical protein